MKRIIPNHHDTPGLRSISNPPLNAQKFKVPVIPPDFSGFRFECLNNSLQENHSNLPLQHEIPSDLGFSFSIGNGPPSSIMPKVVSHSQVPKGIRKMLPKIEGLMQLSNDQVVQSDAVIKKFANAFNLKSEQLSSYFKITPIVLSNLKKAQNLSAIEFEGKMYVCMQTKNGHIDIQSKIEDTVGNKMFVLGASAIVNSDIASGVVIVDSNISNVKIGANSYVLNSGINISILPPGSNIAFSVMSNSQSDMRLSCVNAEISYFTFKNKRINLPVRE